MPAEKKVFRPSKEILITFYGLASYDQKNREKAALQLIKELRNADEKILEYVLERLIKGLASPRENARLGFAVALTELLERTDDISCDDALNSMDINLPLKGASENAKNNAVGQLLCLLSFIRSKKCTQAIDKIIEKLNAIVQDRRYLELSWAQAIISLSALADDEAFRNSIWPSIKPVINVGLDACTPNILWTLLELDKTHQKFMRKKAKLFQDDDWPSNEEKSYTKIGKILAAGGQSSPSGVHPLGKCLLSAMIAGDNFDGFWTHTVSGYLLPHDDKLASAVGLRMIGDALLMTPSKKQLKCIFSVETIKSLLKALLDRRPAAKFTSSIAWAQLGAVQNFVTQNKANAAVQVLVLKRFLDVSVNFDSVSGSKLVHGIFGVLSKEAAALATEELVSKLQSQRLKEDGQQLQSSEIIAIMKLLLRIFECSKFAVSEAADYRLKIAQLLADAAFAKSGFISMPTTLSSAMDSTIVKNLFMRCLELLCVVSTAHRATRPKFEFPEESISILCNLMDMFIDRKHRRLSDECNVPLKAEQEKVAAKAAVVYHQLVKLLKGSDETNVDASSNKGFLVLIGYMVFWFINDPDAYMQSLEDTLTCYEKSRESSKDDSGLHWTDVLIDLLLGTLSRPHRYIRCPLQVSFHYFCPLLNLDNIQPLLKAIKPSETDSFLAADDEGSEASDDQQDQQSQNENNTDTWTSSGEGSEDDENESANDGEDASVDPAFRRAIEDALGDAAAHSDTESTASDLSDEAMLKLDASLAAVFRSHLSGTAGKKTARDLAEQAQAFRVRCFDLLFVLLDSQPSTDVLTGLLMPLLNVANEAVRISDQKNVFYRAKHVIERVVQIKKLPSTPGSDSGRFSPDLLEMIKDVVEFSRNCTNPMVQLLASECLRFLLRFGDEGGSRDKLKFETETKQFFAKQLEEYLKDRSCLTPTCIFTAAFQKRPHMFVENLPALIDSVFNNDVRPFRRREACSLIHCLLNKEALTGAEGKTEKDVTKAWKHFVDRLYSSTLEAISVDENGSCVDEAADSASSSSVKQNHLFDIFSVLRAVANFQELMPLRKLQDDAFLDKLEETKSSSLGAMKSRGGLKRKRVKLATLCSELTKKLRRSDDKANGVGGTSETSHGQESLSSPRAKRKKTKSM